MSFSSTLGETRKSGRVVAGRTEPRRRTIFRRAYETFSQRAAKSWGTGFRIYLSILRPLWKGFLFFCQRGWNSVARLVSFIATVSKNWKKRSSRLFGWAYNGSAGVLKWMSDEWEDTKTTISAAVERRELLPTDLKTRTKWRSCLVSLLVRSMAAGIAVWVIRGLYQPVSEHIGELLYVILSFVFFILMISDLSTLLIPVVIFMGIPIIVLLGIVGFIALAIVSLIYLSLLLCILTAIIGVSLGGIALLLAGIAGIGAAATILFIPIAFGTIGFGFYLLGIVVMQLVVLLAIIALRPGQYVWVLIRGIAYVCPSGRCSSLQVPAHICPDCGSAYSKLWPSIYGVFDHQCEGVKNNNPCHRHLPTLDSRGRNQLNRVCVHCGSQFVSRSSGKLPVTVVGIVGGTSVGKTTMMLMATAELIARSQEGKYGMKAKIDTDDQNVIFTREVGRLKNGLTVAPTSGSVPDAFILQVEQEKSKTLLYLYDAPGEEFSHIDTFSQHHWLQRADGLMLLVDPASLSGFVDQARDLPNVQASKTPLSDIVNSCIASAEKMMDRRTNKGLSTPLAVVITKADLEAVKHKLGDLSTGIRDGAQCRTALLEWGAGGAMQAIEKRFSNVHYFACSALGRTHSEDNTAPFSASGVLDPFLWILKEANSLKHAGEHGVSV